MRLSCIAVPALLLCTSYATGQYLPNTWSRSCPGAAAHSPRKSIGNDDFIELQRTICFGTCPIYTVRLYGDGRLIWHGDKFVNTVGDADARVAPQVARAIIERARGQGFWKLCGEYAASVTDYPTVFTSISLGGEVKKVSDYAQTAPYWLRDLDSQVDKLAEVEKWRKLPRVDAP